LEVYALREEPAKSRTVRAVYCRDTGRARIALVLPRFRFRQPLAHPPDDRGDDEQVDEDEAAAEEAERREHRREREADEGSERPGQLRRSDVLCAILG